jgi:hypothetical protein
MSSPEDDVAPVVVEAPSGKTQTVAVAPAVPAVSATPVQPDEDHFPLTLNEFCTQLSGTDKRVSLIGGFHHTETVAGTIKDTIAAFTARYETFINQPA